MTPQALLQDVCEHPDDDAPRLIYADWLDDHGGIAEQARAEFIRVQCELDRLPEDDPRWAALQKRERQLLRAHRPAWESERPPFATGKSKGEWLRGFLVPGLREPVSRFVQRRPEEFFPFPLWRVTLHGLANVPDKLERVTELAACPNLLRAAELNLTSNAIGPEGAARFAACPHLGNVTVLNLRRNWMRPEGAQDRKSVV